jgi:pimeloyl-ACP methyl ester carboxylesterase
MRKRSAGLVLAVVGVALVVFMISPLYERFFGRKRLRFPYLSRPIAAAAYDALAAKPGWAKAEVEVAPSVVLRGLVRRPTSAARPWVLFFPGNDESQLDRGQSFLVGLGGEEDWGLAVFGYRGYDASDGKTGLAAMSEDAPEILARLCQKESVEPTRVHVVGFSIGGHFAVRAARAAADRGARAGSLTLLAPVNDIVMYHAGPLEKLSAGEDYQTSPLVAGIPAPVLVLQGTADEALDGPGQGHDLAKAFGDRARYVERPGVKHVPLLFDAEALKVARAFVKEHAR